MKPEFVRVGNGKKRHIRYDQSYTYCGWGPFSTATEAEEALPLCKVCEREFNLREQRRAEARKGGKNETDTNTRRSVGLHNRP